jgi:hypothetical protein
MRRTQKLTELLSKQAIKKANSSTDINKIFLKTLTTYPTF